MAAENSVKLSILSRSLVDANRFGKRPAVAVFVDDAAQLGGERLRRFVADDSRPWASDKPARLRVRQRDRGRRPFGREAGPAACES